MTERSRLWEGSANIISSTGASLTAARASWDQNQRPALVASSQRPTTAPVVLWKRQAPMCSASARGEGSGPRTRRLVLILTVFIGCSTRGKIGSRVGGVGRECVGDGECG